MKTLPVVLMGVVCLLVGWFAAGEGSSVEAQTQPAMRSCFEIVDPDGNSTQFLLNHCSGQSWYYDSGLNRSFSRVRPRSWRALERLAQ